MSEREHARARGGCVMRVSERKGGGESARERGQKVKERGQADEVRQRHTHRVRERGQAETHTKFESEVRQRQAHRHRPVGVATITPSPWALVTKRSSQ